MQCAKFDSEQNELPNFMGTIGFPVIIHVPWDASKPDNYLNIWNILLANVCNLEKTGVNLVSSGNGWTYDLKGAKKNQTFTVLYRKCTWWNNFFFSINLRRKDYQFISFWTGMNNKNHWRNLKSPEYFKYILARHFPGRISMIFYKLFANP